MDQLGNLTKKGLVIIQHMDSWYDIIFEPYSDRCEHLKSTTVLIKPRKLHEALEAIENYF